MTAVVLAGAWAVAVLVLVAPLVAPSAARRRLQPWPSGGATDHPEGGPALGGARRAIGAHPLGWLGRQVWRPTRASGGPRDQQRAGTVAAAVGAALVAVALVGAGPPVAVGSMVVVVAVRRRRRTRRAEASAVVEGLPEVVDLLRVAVDAGSTVAMALRALAPLVPAPFDEELRGVLRRAEGGVPLADALDALPVALGEPVRPVVAALQGSERYGSPLADALDRIATDVRRQRRQRAEEAARTLPVRLIFPLVLCTLPALVLLTIAPVVAGAVASLRL